MITIFLVVSLAIKIKYENVFDKSTSHGSIERQTVVVNDGVLCERICRDESFPEGLATKQLTNFNIFIFGKAFSAPEMQVPDRK